jgi:hypothetical protein
MKCAVVLLISLTAGVLVPVSNQVAAAEIGAMQHAARSGERVYVLPFPRSERAQSVWGETACWQDCQRTCVWGLTECLYRDAQGTCLQITDRCDRYCQSQCRSRGGPYLPIGYRVQPIQSGATGSRMPMILMKKPQVTTTEAAAIPAETGQENRLARR